MKIFKCCCLNLFLSLITTNSFAQRIVDPYNRFDQNKYLDSTQTDFSSDFLVNRLNKFFGTKDITGKFKKKDLKTVWLRPYSQNGILGREYKRMKIKILEIEKDKGKPLVYNVRGKTKVNENICDFHGIIRILKIFQFDSGEGTVTDSSHASLIAEYEFNEDAMQNRSGRLKGILESSVILNPSGRVFLDTTWSISDGFYNNTFVGTWKDYVTLEEKKCIWGEGRLPYTFDFDIGDGEMAVNEKYKKNGWQTFGMFDQEYSILSDGTVVEKNKWWEIEKPKE